MINLREKINFGSDLDRRNKVVAYTPVFEVFSSFINKIIQLKLKKETHASTVD